MFGWFKKKKKDKSVFTNVVESKWRDGLPYGDHGDKTVEQFLSEKKNT